MNHEVPQMFLKGLKTKLLTPSSVTSTKKMDLIKKKMKRRMEEVIVAKSQVTKGHFTNKEQRKLRGNAIKKLREAKGLSPTELGLLVGVSRESISTVENGGKDVNMATMDYWCSAIGGKLLILPEDML